MQGEEAPAQSELQHYTAHPAEPGVLCLQKDELKGLVENIGEPLWLQGFPPEDQAWFHHISTSNRTTQ